MIRVPFSSPQDSSLDASPPVQGVEAERAQTVRQRAEMLELRIMELENRLAEHAERMRVQVMARVGGLQQRIETAIRPFYGEKERCAEADNVVNFLETGKSLHHLHATNAAMALNELNQTLQHTREHLDALGHSVERIRQAVEKGKAL